MDDLFLLCCFLLGFALLLGVARLVLSVCITVAALVAVALVKLRG